MPSRHDSDDFGQTRRDRSGRRASDDENRDIPRPREDEEQDERPYRLEDKPADPDERPRSRRRDDDDDPDERPRSRRSSERRDDLKIQKGKIVPLSTEKTLKHVARPVLVALFGIVLVGVFISTGGRARGNLAVAVLCGAFVIAAIVFFLCYAGGHLRRLLRRERFIIGKTSLQLVQGRDDVCWQLPFDNIRTISLTSIVMNDAEVPIIGIGLIDRQREDTIFSGQEYWPFPKRGGIHVGIRDLYDMSLEGFYNRLMESWVKRSLPDQTGPGRAW